MKFIQTIIAFFLIYLFVFSLIFVLLSAYWLNSFVPNMPKQSFAKITVGTKVGPNAPFEYSYSKNMNALQVAISRGTAQESKDEQKVLAARSSVIFATFDKVTLPDFMVPLGYKTLYRLKKATDANGTVLYNKDKDMLDTLISQWNEINWTYENITLVASDRPITYTITTTEDKLFLSQ